MNQSAQLSAVPSPTSPWAVVGIALTGFFGTFLAFTASQLLIADDILGSLLFTGVALRASLPGLLATGMFAALLATGLAAVVAVWRPVVGAVAAVASVVVSASAVAVTLFGLDAADRAILAAETSTPVTILLCQVVACVAVAVRFIARSRPESVRAPLPAGWGFAVVAGVCGLIATTVAAQTSTMLMQ